MTQCNKCKGTFYIDLETRLAELEGMTVQYFRCPHCGEPYIILAADEEMKKLIDENKNLRQSMVAAHQKGFRKKTIDNYMGKLNKIKARQNALHPKLKKRALELLRTQESHA